MSEGLRKFANHDAALTAIYDWERRLERRRLEFTDELTSELGELEVAILEDDLVRCEQAAFALKAKIITIGFGHDIPEIGDAISGVFFLISHFRRRAAGIEPDES